MRPPIPSFAWILRSSASFRLRRLIRSRISSRTIFTGSIRMFTAGLFLWTSHFCSSDHLHRTHQKRCTFLWRISYHLLSCICHSTPVSFSILFCSFYRTGRISRRCILLFRRLLCRSPCTEALLAYTWPSYHLSYLIPQSADRVNIPHHSYLCRGRSLLRVRGRWRGSISWSRCFLWGAGSPGSWGCRVLGGWSYFWRRWGISIWCK